MVRASREKFDLKLHRVATERDTGEGLQRVATERDTGEGLQRVATERDNGKGLQSMIIGDSPVWKSKIIPSCISIASPDLKRCIA